MAKKLKKAPLSEVVAQLATRRDVRDLARKTEAGFEQLVVTLASVVKLMQKQQRLATRNSPRHRRRAA
jgi:hypothetical protein